MRWSSLSAERGAVTGEESLSLIEGGVELEAHRGSSSFEEVEYEKDTITYRPRRWTESFSEWWTQLIKAVISHGAIPRPHPELIFWSTIAFIQAVLVFLLPSFLVRAQQQRQHASGGSGQTREKPPNPTAYFDGLRGVAALVVYVFHFGYSWFPSLRDGYGAPGSKDMFWQLPIVRVLHSGRSSVTIFFVLSGYVVTAKTMSLLYQQQQPKPDQVLHSLSGALFRRPFRLYLPIIASTLAILALVRLDVFPPNNSYGAPPRAQSCAEQLYHWYGQTVHMINPFRAITGRVGLYSPPYDGHLWTIPVEFKGSLTVFALILAFARARCWLRLAGVAAAGAWLVQLGDSDVALFCAGLILVEVALIFPPDSSPAAAAASSSSSSSLSSSENTSENTLDLPSPASPQQSRKRGGSSRATVLRHMWTLALFTLALHLLSYPETKGLGTPGYRTISHHVPEFYAPHEERIQQFYISIGAVLFVIGLMYSPPVSSVPGVNSITTAASAIGRSLRTIFCFCSSSPSSSSPIPPITTTMTTEGDNSNNHNNNNTEDTTPSKQQHPKEPLLQRPFTTALAQYLGRISYALYLAHGTVNAIISERWLRPAYEAWARDQNSAEALLVAYVGANGPGVTNGTVVNMEMVMVDLDLATEVAYDDVLAKARLRYGVQFACAALINTVVLFWTSDVFWRLVDARAVRATRRLWGWASKTGSN